MIPNYTSVYDNTWDATTWALVFTIFVTCFVGLMVALIGAIHHASQASLEPPPVKQHQHRHLSRPHWFGRHHGTPAHI
ncbi:MAG: hypothetical protein J7518_06400 [Nocardioidaceae bacterium]|nr:hypothetical protein [Nocardioidaceae bacterium]